MGANGFLSLRVAYKIFPVNQPDPQLPGESHTWVPVLTVSLIIGHAQSRKFEAVVDSGSAVCLFHADIGKAHGLKLRDGVKGSLGGVVGGSFGEVFYYKAKLCFGGQMFTINAGFSESLSVAALLGRHGFFEHFAINFDPANHPPGFDLTRIHRA